jgi:hypothetical protein
MSVVLNQTRRSLSLVYLLDGTTDQIAIALPAPCRHHSPPTLHRLSGAFCTIRSRPVVLGLAQRAGHSAIFDQVSALPWRLVLFVVSVQHRAALEVLAVLRVRVWYSTTTLIVLLPLSDATTPGWCGAGAFGLWFLGCGCHIVAHSRRPTRGLRTSRFAL